MELPCNEEIPFLIPSLIDPKAAALKFTPDPNETANNILQQQRHQTTVMNFSIFNQFDDASSSDKFASWVYGLVSIAATSMLPVLGFLFHPFVKQPFVNNIMLIVTSQTTAHLLTTASLIYLPKTVGRNPSNDLVENIHILTIFSIIFACLLFCFNLEVFNRLDSLSNMSKRPYSINDSTSSTRKIIVSESGQCTIHEPNHQNVGLLQSAASYLFIFAECLLTFCNNP